MVPARRRLLAAGGAAALAGAALPRGAAFAQPADLPDVVAAVRPAVHPVGTFSATDNPRFGFRGTGFAIGDGSFIATNAHVLPSSADRASGPPIAVLVRRPLDQPEVRTARVLATDASRDLAILKIEGPPLPALRLDAETPAREGQAVALMGFPIGGALGFAPVVHRGIVASITTVALPAPTSGSLDPRAIRRMREGNFEVLQLDATAYPGNSGGPLFDAASGRVIGIVNMVLVKGSRESALSSPTGITYAIPVRHLVALLDEVRASATPR